MELTAEQVQKFLPHRDPFLFVDSVESITLNGESIPAGRVLTAAELEGCLIEANFHVSKNLPLFAGHFPGNPILPGVIQVEMMAQSACLGTVKLFEKPFEAKLEVALLTIEKAKFRRPIRPGMDLKIYGQFMKVRGRMLQHHCSIECNGEKMSEAQILATLNV